MDYIDNIENAQAENVLELSELGLTKDNTPKESANLAQFARPENDIKDVVSKEEEISFFDTPLIPKSVYEVLPSLLKKNCEVFDSRREKDVFLTGALTILSGCMNTAYGIYDLREYYSNLNCFIIAPAASGKGVLIYAKMLGQSYHDQLVEESQKAQKQYQTAINKLEDKDQQSAENTPQKPPLKVLFIPGNSSSSAIIKHLIDGEEKGVFCETEADTLANSLKQDWGNFSDLLRKAFHHEGASYSRKTNSEYYEIKKPRLSVALSGTPSQVEGLISSAEDGLFSRFIFYAFNAKAEWRSVAPVKGKTNLNSHFEEQAVEVLKMIEFLEANSTSFNLTEAQWEQLDQQFTIWLNDTRDKIGGDALSSIKRLGLILFRVALILTCIRKYEQRIEDYEIVCSDIDFKTALQLITVYKEHALLMFHRLPHSGGINEKAVRQFYDELPKTFKRSEALKVGTKNGMGVRTVDKYLQLLRDSKKVDYTKYGSYIKL